MKQANVLLRRVFVVGPSCRSQWTLCLLHRRGLDVGRIPKDGAPDRHAAETAEGVDAHLSGCAVVAAPLTLVYV